MGVVLLTKNHRKYIWIEAEEWADGEWNIEDDNTDVIVTFSNRSKWIASFFTYKNIQTLREKNKQTGESMNGAYFWSSEMVLIDLVSRERIVEVIEYLIENDEFNSVFTRYPDVEPEEDYLYPEGFFI
ncbi:hypothetical protein BIV60_00550 [Bacillus sp. MUM 116]|uniref:hypothetical protein n=1 Tax=Bacillus sp. MUM 116 TaxID=1678002 RepID=UPI0008F5C478|nr:hypothetical protein [Bacillus sp. MUM 116]OIK17212.1 hypothetical protein BIV60_00550 [Bacillus sp. MUM 116]